MCKYITVISKRSNLKLYTSSSFFNNTLSTHTTNERQNIYNHINPIQTHKTNDTIDCNKNFRFIKITIEELEILLRTVKKKHVI